MPCHDPRDNWDAEHNNVAAQLLCEMMSKLSASVIPWTPELRQWWNDHQDRDAYHARKSSERR